MPIVSASSAPVPTIWKVAIFGAGTTTSNGEYVWDGSEVNDGFRVYRSTSNSNSTMTWEVGGGPNGLGAWNLYDADFDETTYQIESFNFSGTWFLAGGGSSPAPSSALSYSQTSYIQTVVLAGGDPDQSGTYTWDGTTFINGKPKYFGPLKSGASENNYIYWDLFNYVLYGWNTDEMLVLSASIDIASNWYVVDASGAPTVSSIVYSA